MPWRCSTCGNPSDDFALVCPWCGASDTAVEVTAAGDRQERPVPLPDVAAPRLAKVKTGTGEFDRLIAGGFVAGSSVLLSGPPGAGKSTLLLQLLASSALPSLYVSGEESAWQLKIRADRLHVASRDIAVLFETNMTIVASHVSESPPRLLVVDSIQTAYTDLSDSLPGTPAQVRRCTYLLRRLAQEREMVLLLVGQVTKGLQAAGPKTLEHAVDCVLSLAIPDGVPGGRTLEVVKNRFGPAGIFLPLRLTGDGFLFGGG